MNLLSQTLRWQQSTLGLLALKGNRKRECTGEQHLPVESRLLALVLLPNTESKSTLRPWEFCGCWGVGEAVNPGGAKRKLSGSNITERLRSSQQNHKQVAKPNISKNLYFTTTYLITNHFYKNLNSICTQIVIIFRNSQWLELKLCFTWNDAMS